MELVSPSESKRRIEDKLMDYCKIGVQECWLVRPGDETVEVLQLKADSSQRLGLFGCGETLGAAVLPGWSPAIDDFFAPPDFLKWLER